MTASDYELPPPHDLDAEKQVLGCLMHAPARSAEARAVWERVDADDFFNPANQEIAAVMQKRQDEQNDPIVLADVLREGGLLGRVGGHPYLVHLYGGALTVANAGYYAGIVAATARRRNLQETAVRLLQRATSPEVDVLEAVTSATDELASIELLAEHTGRQSTAETLEEFLSRPKPQGRWLVPDLIRAGDRCVYIGGEGLGKSMLTRQIAVCVAAGLHPFTREHTNPGRVLVIDLENDEEDNTHFYGYLMELAERMGRPLNGRLRIEHVPAGLNLLDGRDQARVQRAVVQHNAQICFIGPFYKLAQGKTNEEENALKIVAFFDRLRARTGCGFFIEAHMPQDNNGSRALRPRGSGVLRGWPDVGLGLQPAEDEFASDLRMVSIGHFRGQRGYLKRQWPKTIIAGKRWYFDDFDNQDRVKEQAWRQSAPA